MWTRSSSGYSVPQNSALPEGWRLQEGAIPRRGATILRVIDGQGRRAALKRFAKPGPQARYYLDALEHCHARRDEAAGLSVPEPYGAAGEQGLLCEWIDASRASDLILSRPFGLRRRAIIRRSAQWLRWFHECRPALERPFDPAPMFNAIERVCTAEQRDGLLNHALATLGQLPGSPTLLHGKVHGDFTPSNLFIDGPRTLGFDFTARSTAPLALDACRYLTYLSIYRWWAPSARDLRRWGCSAADRTVFVEAYGGPLALLPQREFLQLQLFELVRRYASLLALRARAEERSWRRALEFYRLRRMVRLALAGAASGR